MKMREILLGLMAMIWLSGCEHELLLSADDRRDRITVNAVANVDTVVYAYIMESTDLNYDGGLMYRADYYSYERRVYRKEQWYVSEEKSDMVLKEANAKLIVNDRDEYEMKYDEKYMSYNSEYVPKEGDRLKIKVKSKSNATASGDVVELDDVEASVEMPSTRPRVEILKTDVYWKKRTYRDVVEAMGDTVSITDMYGADTVMNITMKIVDPGDEKNFYRLLVRSVGYTRLPQAAKGGYICTDDFESTDLLFYDGDLIKQYGTIPAYHTNVFDDELLNGKEYVVEVESRMRRNSEITPYVIVELQHLSPDLYYYMKDMEVFRISDFDLYQYPIQIWSNVKGGWGVFGAMSYDQHILEF